MKILLISSDMSRLQAMKEFMESFQPRHTYFECLNAREYKDLPSIPSLEIYSKIFTDLHLDPNVKAYLEYALREEYPRRKNFIATFDFGDTKPRHFYYKGKGYSHVPSQPELPPVVLRC